MDFNDKERCVVLGEYIAATKATVRACAKEFGISKSTVHKDVSGRLKKIDPLLAARVREILDFNKRERHIRGGEATRRKYRQIAAAGVPPEPIRASKSR